MQIVIDVSEKEYADICKRHGRLSSLVRSGTPLPNKHDNCGACELYDNEKYYCPLYCEVIKQTLKELREADKEAEDG